MIKKLTLLLLLQLAAFSASAAVMVIQGEGDTALNLDNPVDSDQVIVLATPGDSLVGTSIAFDLNNGIQGANVLATFTLNRFASFEDFSLTINGPGTGTPLVITQADFNVSNLNGTFNLILSDLGTGMFTADLAGTIVGNQVANFTWVVDTPANVPLPAAVWLFGSALVGMGTVGRRRKKT